MTQLDLPQLSIGRYLELLARRKWQVVPISLLGMIIGAAIAALVPRYYVANTEVHFNAAIMLTEERRDINDPLEELLSQANTKIRAQVPKVLAKLGWQEYAVKDSDARADFLDEVTKRVRIADLGGSRRGRVNTNLRITYSDTDGERAYTFANKLREEWIADMKDDLEHVANEDVQRAQERLLSAQSAVDELKRDIAQFEQQNKIDPSLRGGNAVAFEGSLAARLQEERGRAAQYELEIAMLDGEIEMMGQRLEGEIPPLIAANPPPPDPAVQQRLLELEQLLLARRNQRRNFQPGSAQYEILTGLLAELEAEKAAKAPAVKQTLVPNPAYVELQKRVEELKNRRRAHATVLEGVQAQIKARELELAQLPVLAQSYNELWTTLEARQKRAQDSSAQMDAALARQFQVRTARPFETILEARQPKRPTEPSIGILAAVGALIGLGVAIGLIFALDAVRFTFKTVEDLERGITVPVLGGVSHVETPGERAQTKRGRIVASSLALLLLFLVVAVVTLYYTAPARLPGWARDVLDLVLGEPE